MKFLKIMAIVLFIVGIGALALAGYRYATDGINAIKRTEAQKGALEEAVAKGETKDKIKQLAGYVESDLWLEDQINQQITTFVVGGIVPLIIGVVLWFVSRRKTGKTEKEVVSGSGPTGG